MDQLLHGERKTLLAEKRTEGDLRRCILVKLLASQRTEQRLGVDGGFTYLARVFRRSRSWFCLHPIVKTFSVNKLQVASTVARRHEVVGETRAVVAVAYSADGFIVTVSAIRRLGHLRLDGWCLSLRV